MLSLCRQGSQETKQRDHLSSLSLSSPACLPIYPSACLSSEEVYLFQGLCNSKSEIFRAVRRLKGRPQVSGRREAESFLLWRTSAFALKRVSWLDEAQPPLEERSLALRPADRRCQPHPPNTVPHRRWRLTQSGASQLPQVDM